MKTLRSEHGNPKRRSTKHRHVITAISHRHTRTRTESKNIFALVLAGRDLPVGGAERCRELASSTERIGREQMKSEATAQLLERGDCGNDRLATMRERSVHVKDQVLERQILSAGNRDLDAHRPTTELGDESRIAMLRASPQGSIGKPPRTID